MNILKMLHNLRFFSSKYSLFHNATLFGSCIIHILNTVCPKIWKKKIPAPQGYVYRIYVIEGTEYELALVIHIRKFGYHKMRAISRLVEGLLFF
jgi:hypothetical protein